MQKNAVNKLYYFWNLYFKEHNKNNIQAWEFNGFDQIPTKIKSKFQMEFAPEPFYGYFHQDISNDTLMLLINPGEISIDSIKKNHKNISDLSDNKVLDYSNNHVAERHLFWNKEDYIKRELEFNSIPKDWRTKMTKMCVKATGEDIGFIHTMEFFPFHSKEWKISDSIEEEWLHNLETTKLMVNAVEEISRERLVQRIIGIGKPWVRILNSYNDKFELVKEETILGPSGAKVAQRLYQYKIKHFSDSLPIVIYVSTAINLPVNGLANKIFRSFLNS